MHKSCLQADVNRRAEQAGICRSVGPGSAATLACKACPFTSRECMHLAHIGLMNTTNFLVKRRPCPLDKRSPRDRTPSSLVVMYAAITAKTVALAARFGRLTLAAALVPGSDLVLPDDLEYTGARHQGQAQGTTSPGQSSLLVVLEHRGQSQRLPSHKGRSGRRPPAVTARIPCRAAVF